MSLRRIVSGRYHNLILEPDGTVKVWSTALSPNLTGELGLGHNNKLERFTLYPIPSLKNVVAAAAGWDCSVVVLSDGRVLSWGTKTSGVLGITPLSELEVNPDPRPDSYAPGPLAVPIDAVDIAEGGYHVLALARDSSVWAWGEGKRGQLGIGPMPVIQFKTHRPSAMDYVPFPVHIPGLTGVVAISAGFQHSLALLKDGTIRAWGANKDGELGDGTVVDRATPVEVQGIRTAVAISASNSFSVAALADGTVMLWGRNTIGSLGRQRRLGDDLPHPVPEQVPGVAGVRAVAAGNGCVLALTKAGTGVSWGWDASGDTGQGFNASGNFPRPVGVIKGLAGAHAVAAGSSSFAVLEDGRIMTWGSVREWDRPGGWARTISPAPILLKIDGLNNP